MYIGKSIKEIRKSKKLSQIELAEMTGLTQTSISNIEAGVVSPHQNTIVSICKVLNISVMYLYTYSLSPDGIKAELLPIFENTKQIMLNLLDIKQ